MKTLTYHIDDQVESGCEVLNPSAATSSVSLLKNNTQNTGGLAIGYDPNIIYKAPIIMLKQLYCAPYNDDTHLRHILFYNLDDQTTFTALLFTANAVPSHVRCVYNGST